MADALNVLIVGVGGQGTILAGKVLARVAVLSGKDVKFSEIHGMAQRGGSVVTQVRIGDAVHSPTIDPACADFLLAFEQLEGLRWAHMLRPGGTIIVSTQRIDPATVLMGVAVYPSDVLEQLALRGVVVALDALEMACAVGNSKASNVVLLGRLARGLGLSRDLWEQALRDVIPARHLEVNEAAFAAGWSSK
ncbi:MAG TPA: indolepyruvate oxidoreductase subunit beta [Armatimonadota bacterium]